MKKQTSRVHEVLVVTAVLAAMVAVTTSISGTAAANADAGADEPLLAFPGAEGAGRYAVGGRGGDVYHVTTLDDDGPGSLRHAVESADGPRTIVFDVGGTIRLESELRTHGLSHLTVAGQTAPGDGITIADAGFWVNHGEHIIIQHLRFAPGDTLTRDNEHETLGEGDPDGYYPNSLRIWDCRNVIVDHVSARWGSEENLSVSHGSDNVTVQYSIVAEGLRLADHFKGERAYGSIIDGGRFTFHHNLYAHNRTRNPRPGTASGNTTLDWVNNVIYNPELDYGYGGGEGMRINIRRNIGIHGPDTRATTLFDPWNATTAVYHDDNYLDDSPTRALALTPAGGERTITRTFQTMNEPAELPATRLQSARRAYINVLSHAGARPRDHHDRRVVRDVINKTGGYVDRPEDVGGWAELEAGESVVSTANDGIPDWWKREQGLDPEQSYHQETTDEGYTYLEKYLHSLTTHSHTPEGARQLVVRTSEGQGADGHVTIKPDGSTHVDESADAIVAARPIGIAENDHGFIFLQFDMSQLEPGSIVDAEMEMTVFGPRAPNYLQVWGIEDSQHQSAAMARDFDAFLTANGEASPAFSKHHLLRLGELKFIGWGQEEISRFDNPNLAVWLNLMSRQMQDQESRVVTLLIARVTEGQDATAFASHRADQLEEGEPAEANDFAPRLMLEITDK